MTDTIKSCEAYEKPGVGYTEKISSLGADHPFICNQDCKYDNKDKGTNICRTRGKITKRNLAYLAKTETK